MGKSYKSGGDKFDRNARRATRNAKRVNFFRDPAPIQLNTRFITGYGSSDRADDYPPASIRGAM